MRYLLVALAACGATGHDTASRPKLGLIAGLARDKNTGEGLERVEITVGAYRGSSGPHGIYQIDGIAPGTYTVVARYANQPITVSNVDVSAGLATFVDLPFSVGTTDPVTIDYRALGQNDVEHFTTPVSRIEGTLSDAQSHARVEGAVVTAANDHDTLQTITDDAGRFRFDSVMPGTYAVSAYYSLGGRGQIEVRRGGITIAEHEGVLVPLVIELQLK